MSKKRTLISAGVILIGLIWGAKQIFGDEEPAQRAAQDVAVPTIENSGRKLVVDDSASRACSQIEPLFPSAKPYIATDPAKMESLIDEAYSDPLKLAQRADSDPDVYIALFQLAVSCFPELMYPGAEKRVISGCPKINFKMQEHPMKLLERAAQLGSVDAKLKYALNSKLYAARFRKTGTQAGIDTATKMLARAELFGTEAAKAGNPEAYRYMSNAYEHGYFGKRDTERALTFALPLKPLGIAADMQKIEELSLKLTASEKESALKTAFGCGIVHEPDSNKSPF